MGETRRGALFQQDRELFGADQAQLAQAFTNWPSY